MSGPGSCVRLSWRAWLLLAVAVVVGAALAGVAGQAHAHDSEAQASNSAPAAGSNITLSLTVDHPSAYWEVYNTGWDPLDGDSNHTVVSTSGDEVVITRHSAGLGYYRAKYVESGIASATNFDAAAAFITVVWGDAVTIDPPGQVTGVGLTVDSSSAIAVSWNAATDADGYLVQWRTGGQSFGSANQASATATGHTITGLAASTAYDVRVIATRTGADNGTPSATASATTETTPTVSVSVAPASLTLGETATITAELHDWPQGSDAAQRLRMLVTVATATAEAGSYVAACGDSRTNVIRDINNVNENPEIRTSATLGTCPAGDYEVRVYVWPQSQADPADAADYEARTHATTAFAVNSAALSAPGAGDRRRPDGRLRQCDHRLVGRGDGRRRLPGAVADRWPAVRLQPPGQRHGDQPHHNRPGRQHLPTT